MGNLFAKDTKKNTKELTTVNYEEKEEKEYIRFFSRNCSVFEPVFETEWVKVSFIHMTNDTTGKGRLHNEQGRTSRLYTLAWNDPSKQPIEIHADKYEIYTRSVLKTPQNLYVPAP